MMGAVEGAGHSITRAHSRAHDREVFPGQGRRLGHMRGTARSRAKAGRAALRPSLRVMAAM